MPVTIRTSTNAPAAPVQLSDFDKAVHRLAPVINDLVEFSKGRSIQKLVDRLNKMDHVGPKGKPLNYSTLRRVLQRMETLKLGTGPRSQSRAAEERRVPYHPRKRRQINFAALKATLAKPDTL